MNSNPAPQRSQFQTADFENAAIQRLCDVVMKGGVTSGVVYPLAICELATKYVIKNIGGTSVGAIAAALTAAAEYRRREFSSGQGYCELAKLPDFLGQPGALLKLFAADRKAAGLLKVALIPTGCAPFAGKLARFVGALMSQYIWIPLTAVFVVAAAIVYAAWPPHGLVFWIRCFGEAIVFGMIAALVGVSARFAYHIIHVLNTNNFGWCHGYNSGLDAKLDSVPDVTGLTADQVPPLTSWLDAFIAQAAGKPRADPLTFGDLWNTKQPEWHNAASSEHCIDFRMVTTCLTLGRPFEIPFNPDERISLTSDPRTDIDDSGKRRPSLYFDVDEIAEYFPPAVVQKLKAHGKRSSLGTGTYYRFPAADKLPIVVGARLSMSFPVLFCAIPLYAADVAGTMQKLWFSDGGLTSNFPIHFFDSPLPRWPTFGIDLLGGEPPVPPGKQNAETRALAMGIRLQKSYSPAQVFMESELQPGTVNPWDVLDRGRGRGNVMAFASAILDAARNWQDVTLSALPGNASRTVGIRLSDDQGGLNLNMPPSQIQDMLELGRAAGDKLLSTFAPGDSNSGWERHRWIRYRATMGAITRWIDGYQTGFTFRDPSEHVPYETLVRQNVPDPAIPKALTVTTQIASIPIDEMFYELEEKPMAVLPTRPIL